MFGRVVIVRLVRCVAFGSRAHHCSALRPAVLSGAAAIAATFAMVSYRWNAFVEGLSGRY